MRASVVLLAFALAACAAPARLTIWSIAPSGAPALAAEELPLCTTLVSAPGVELLDSHLLRAAGSSSVEPVVLRSAEALAAALPIAAERELVLPVDFEREVVVLAQGPVGAHLTSALLPSGGTVLVVTMESSCGGAARGPAPIGAVVPREHADWALIAACPDEHEADCSGPPRP